MNNLIIHFKDFQNKDVKHLKCLAGLNNINVYKNSVRIDGFYSIGKVPDVWRYNIEIDDCKINIHEHRYKHFKKSNFNDIFPSSHKLTNSIIVILESPHDEEYDYISNLPIAPAQGKTGNSIKYHIDNVLRKISKNKTLSNGFYELIIVNPVQYQASLHYIHKNGMDVYLDSEHECGKISKIRNIVWKHLWLIEKKFIKSRLLKYKPYLILNCCTSDIKSEISNYLKLHFNNSLLFESSHPSSWNEYFVKLI